MNQEKIFKALPSANLFLFGINTAYHLQALFRAITQNNLQNGAQGEILTAHEFMIFLLFVILLLFLSKNVGVKILIFIYSVCPFSQEKNRKLTKYWILAD